MRLTKGVYSLRLRFVIIREIRPAGLNEAIEIYGIGQGLVTDDYDYDLTGKWRIGRYYAELARGSV